jgi:ribosomal protein L7/L12
MHKLTVRVSDRVRDAIAAEAARKKISMAELMRVLAIRHVPGAAEAVIVDDVELSAALWTHLQECRRDKRKISAIKAVRNETGLGLREAKAVVDSIWDNLR